MKVVVLACAVATSTLLCGADVALCVGIDEYDALYVPGDRWLAGCASDAEYFADFLTGEAGWRRSDVRMLVNAAASGDAVLAALVEMAESAALGDRVVYYHSGHGYRSEDGDVCLCAYDRDLTGEEVASAFGLFPEGVRPLVVLDACYSGGFFSGHDRACDFAWLSSAAAGEESAEADGNGGGVFTKAFVGLLRSGVCDLIENGGDGNGVCTAYEGWAAASSRLEWWGMTPQCGLVPVCESFGMCERPAITTVSVDSIWPGVQNCQSFVQDWDRAFGSWVKLGDLNGVGWYLELDEDGRARCGRSAPLLDYQRAYMEADVLGSGRLSFTWGVSSEAAHDFLRFSVDGVSVTAISGEVDRETVVFDVTGSGAHRIGWVYEKDELYTEGADCGYVWNVAFTPARETEEAPRAFVPKGDFAASKARTDNGVLVKDGEAFGVLQVKVGKESKTGESKVSVTVIGLDGKKYTAKAVKVQTGGTPTVDFEVKKLGTLTLTFGANGFSGSLGGAMVISVDVAAATTDGKAAFAAGDLSSLAGVLTEYLPQGEAVERTEKKWKVAAKAGKLKYVKPNAKKGIAGGLEARGDNIAALKLTYAEKTQTFKGSFKVWTFDDAKKKLKSVSAKVTGIVINGEGFGEVRFKGTKIGKLMVK